jgi:hypothetical protein
LHGNSAIYFLCSPCKDRRAIFVGHQSSLPVVDFACPQYWSFESRRRSIWVSSFLVFAGRRLLCFPALQEKRKTGTIGLNGDSGCIHSAPLDNLDRTASYGTMTCLSFLNGLTASLSPDFSPVCTVVW